MKIVVSAIALAAVLFGSAQAAQRPTGTLVVALKQSDQAAVVDVATGRVLRLFDTGDNPHELLLSADGKLAVVSDYGRGADSLTVFDPAVADSGRRIRLGKHRGPHGLAWDVDGKRVLATTERGGTVIALDPLQDSPPLAVEAGQSHMVAVDYARAVAYTTDGPGNRVYALDLKTWKLTGEHAVPARPEAIGVDPRSGEVWVGSNAEGTVSALDPATGEHELVATGMQWPYRILFVPSRQLALIPDLAQQRLLAVSTDDYSVVHDMDLAGGRPQGVLVTADARWAFLALNAQDRVAVIDLETFEISKYLDLPKGSAPDGMGFLPAAE